MADSRVATGLTVEQWDDKFFAEYLTENRFASEFGTNENNVIQVKENLTRKPGDRITYALVNRLTNDAVTGRTTLEGAEEDMATRSFEQLVDKRRNGVRFAEVDEQFSAISLREAAKHVLKDWSMKDTETLIIQALASINGVPYASATEGQKDAWLVDNSDRVLFGIAAAGYTDHSADLALLDTTNDSYGRRHLEDEVHGANDGGPENPSVRSAKNGRHYYILYCDPACSATSRPKPPHRSCKLREKFRSSSRTTGYSRAAICSGTASS